MPLPLDQKWRTRAICALLLVGGATVDFSPAAIFRSLLISDVCLIAAGVLALPIGARSVASAARALRRRHPELLALALLGLSYLVGTGFASLVNGPSGEAAHTWLLFLLLIVGIVPSVAVATSSCRACLGWLVAGLLLGAMLGAGGFIGQVAAGADLFGARLRGLLDSDPLFLMIVGAGISAAYLFAPRAKETRAGLRRTLTAGAVAALVLIAVALVLSKYRSAWIGYVAVIFLSLVVMRRSVKGGLIAAAIVVALFVGAYFASLLPPEIETRVEMTFDAEDPGNTQRIDVIGELLPVWAEKPWGIGLGASSDYLSQEFIRGQTGGAHNVVLHALIEGGPLAGLAMLLLPVVLIWAWVRAVSRSPGLDRDWLRAWPFVSILPLYLAAQLTPTLYQHVNWVTIGALVGSVLAASSDPAADPAPRPG